MQKNIVHCNLDASTRQSRRRRDGANARRERFTSRHPLNRCVADDNDDKSSENGEILQMIGCLTAGVAHDFNNLLTAIIGNSQLALRRLDGGGNNSDDDLAANIREIESAGMHAAKLAAQLLKLSRGEKVQFEALALNDSISEITALIGRLIGKHIQLDFVPGQHLDNVYASSTNIEQIMLNLCINARDAMPAGGRIVITTENLTLRNKRYVAIGVRDTGTGIEADTRKRMFEAFFTTKKNGTGTGLGLNSVQRIVKAHRGFIKVRSRLGQGTIFKIFLPAIMDN